MKQKNVTITFRGWPGHFICADRCNFRLNTLIECDGRAIVVSTVGGLRLSDNGGWETIGHNRYFETKVFNANGTQYQDADVTNEISIGSDHNRFVSHVNDNAEIQANAMHNRTVDWVAERLANGESLQ
jgi:hypothetical protein